MRSCKGCHSSCMDFSLHCRGSSGISWSPCFNNEQNRKKFHYTAQAFCGSAELIAALSCFLEWFNTRQDISTDILRSSLHDPSRTKIALKWNLNSHHAYGWCNGVTDGNSKQVHVLNDAAHLDPESTWKMPFPFQHKIQNLIILLLYKT